MLCGAATASYSEKRLSSTLIGGALAGCVVCPVLPVPPHTGLTLAYLGGCKHFTRSCRLHVHDGAWAFGGQVRSRTSIGFSSRSASLQHRTTNNYLDFLKECKCLRLDSFL